ncbi:hypothetical protein NUW58_g8151 [Xylaria curta]|uniref:Uncharacterized protein n=1 Tax=Xylaria curta TaxID=42375 RepID=A0ACC1NBD2_9PEZI|nr:hypothetical protein NUW58_g8151 [Xylaria curta]
MDPVTALGAAGSVVGIAGFGLQLSEVLIKFISKVRSAQDHLDEVVTEIDATASALQELYSFLKQEVRNVESDKSLRLFSESSLVKVKVTADKCLVVFWRIETNIAGSEPDGFEEELAKRLTSFNRRLESYGLGHHVMVGSPITPDPLSFRRKVRWAFQASKLEKFCKDLQRYQGHLSLLLQIVLLGQQQMKQNPTTQDILLMRQTFAFITQIATPEELKLMAIEAQEDGERRRSRSKAPAGSRVPRPSLCVLGYGDEAYANDEPVGRPTNSVRLHPDTQKQETANNFGKRDAPTDCT